MAYFQNQFLKSYAKDQCFVDGSFSVLSTQTSNTANYKVTNVTGTGIANIALVATGIYQISFVHPHYNLLDMSVYTGGLEGTPVAIASLVSGTAYVISTVGTSQAADWQAAGLPAAQTPTVGTAFVAGSGASGATGTGYAAPAITTGVQSVQIFGDPNQTVGPNNQGTPYLYLMFLGATSSSVTTLTPTTPADTTFVRFSFMFRDSSLKEVGE